MQQLTWSVHPVFSKNMGWTLIGASYNELTIITAFQGACALFQLHCLTACFISNGRQILAIIASHPVSRSAITNSGMSWRWRGKWRWSLQSRGSTSLMFSDVLSIRSKMTYETVVYFKLAKPVEKRCQKQSDLAGISLRFGCLNVST